ncbi:two-component system, NarL family, response regulator LiaR [Bacillus sp. OV322]|nr:two-component system, NarL family, response regulator LiaR [Bacillus sp. OV322]
MTKIRIAVIDDHELVRKGIISFLETEPDIEIVGEGSSGRDAINLAAKHKPDVILMDLLMENGTVIEATKEIMETGSACRIVILTSYFDEKEVFPALEAGAFSYLLKTSPAFDVASAIRKAAKGEAVIEPRVTDVMVKRLRNRSETP